MILKNTLLQIKSGSLNLNSFVLSWILISSGGVGHDWLDHKTGEAQNVQ